MPWISAIACFGLLAATALADPGSWQQFRGPNATGKAVNSISLPADIAPDRRVVWRCDLPPGHSSPVVVGNRIYVTGVREPNRLVTIAVDRSTGDIVWEAEAPYEEAEEIHAIGSLAQPSCCVDGERVVSFFGSAGLFCYDADGQRQWHRDFGRFKNNFGAGSSPILVDDWVIINQDHDTDSFLMAIDKRTGETVWQTDRSEFPRGYATPIIWEVGGARQIVVSGTLRVVGYDFDSGNELWTVRGISRIVNMTPTVGDDGTLYVPAWAPGGDESNRIDVEPFDRLAAERDANKNGALELEEMPDGQLKIRFDQIDRDKDAQITRNEYESMRQVFDMAHNVMLAIKPGGRGDVSNTHVLWTQSRMLPYVPSPVYHQGHLFMVKDGGITSSVDAHTGAIAKTARVSGTGQYYSSPVAGDGKIYLLSQKGVLTVISAEPEWKELHSADFGEEAFATPAIVDGQIFLRTSGHLYCFALGPAS